MALGDAQTSADKFCHDLFNDNKVFGPGSDTAPEVHNYGAADGSDVGVTVSVRWRPADDCPTLDFTGDNFQQAIDTCNQRLGTIINTCKDMIALIFPSTSFSFPSSPSRRKSGS